MSTSATGTTPYYFVPEPSRHPAMAAFGLLCIFFGAVQWLNDHGWAAYLTLFGFLWLFAVLFQWFR